MRAQWALALAAPIPVWERTYWSSKPDLSMAARALVSVTENSQIAMNATGIEMIAALRFEECSGQRRLLQLSLIERVEDIDASLFGRSGGDAFVRLDGRLVPVANGLTEFGRDKISALRLRDAGLAVQASCAIEGQFTPVRIRGELYADADRLTQAIWNLVRNALQSGASQVGLRTRAEHHVLIGDTAHRLSLRVEISDNGRGVPEDLAEQIFLPLVSGRAEGTGLGLAMAQQVAREHGGSLGYRSRPGHTVFTLLLPVNDVESDDE